MPTKSNTGVRANLKSLAALLLLALFAVGCGDDTHYAPVAGTVMAGDHAVEGITVSFEPATGTPDQTAVGTTDSEGRFRLESVGDFGGAVVGRNRVILSFALSAPHDDEFTPVPDRRAPLAFRDGSTIFEVPSGGTEAADFEIGKIEAN